GGVIGLVLDGQAELDNGLIEVAKLGQRAGVVAMGVGRTGGDGELFFEVRNGLADAAAGGEDDTEVGVGDGIAGVGAEGLLEERLGLGEAAGFHQQRGQAVIGAVVGGIHVQGLAPDGDGVVDLALGGERSGAVAEAVELRGGDFEADEPVERDVDELGDVDGAIGGGGVLDEDGRAVVAVLVNVGEVHARVRPAALGGKDQPAAVGRPTVPGVHGRGVAVQAAGGAALRRDDVELAVGAHEQAVAGLDPDDPAAIGGNLGEAIAPAVAGGAGDGLGAAAATVVERNAIEVVLDGGLVGIVGEGGERATGGVGGARLGAEEDDGLAVGAPDAAAVDETGVVGAGQGLELAGGLAIPGQDAAGGVKDLAEAEVLVAGVVNAVGGGAAEGVVAFDGGEDVVAVGRNAAHEAEAHGGDLAAGVPLDDVGFVDDGLGAQGDESVEALVVL